MLYLVVPKHFLYSGYMPFLFLSPPKPLIMLHKPRVLTWYFTVHVLVLDFAAVTLVIKIKKKHVRLLPTNDCFNLNHIPCHLFFSAATQALVAKIGRQVGQEGQGRVGQVGQVGYLGRQVGRLHLGFGKCCQIASINLDACCTFW